MVTKWRWLAAAVALAAVGAGWARMGGAASRGPQAPELRAEQWINSNPRTLAQLRGKVVAVEFWTFG